MATETLTKSLYGGSIEMLFYPASHRYKLAGQKDWLTSVTSVTGLIDKSRILILWAIGLADTHISTFLAERGDMVDKKEIERIVAEALRKHQEIKDEAAGVGKLIHAYAEAYAKAKTEGASMPAIGADLPDQVIAGINSFLDWVKKHNVEFVEAERIVYSKQHGFVGILDAIALVDGKKTLVDYKSGTAVYDESFLQVAAYHEAYREETGENLNIIIAHFDKNTGDFTVHTQDAEDATDKNFAAFLGLLTAKNRLKEMARK